MEMFKKGKTHLLCLVIETIDHGFPITGRWANIFNEKGIHLRPIEFLETLEVEVRLCEVGKLMTLIKMNLVLKIIAKARKRRKIFGKKQHEEVNV